jgi:hypothetical protein
MKHKSRSREKQKSRKTQKQRSRETDIQKKHSNSQKIKKKTVKKPPTLAFTSQICGQKTQHVGKWRISTTTLA